MPARDDREGDGDLDGQTREDEGWWDGMDLLGKVRGQRQRGSSRCSRRSSRGRLVGEHKFEVEADRSVMQQTAASADGSRWLGHRSRRWRRGRGGGDRRLLLSRLPGSSSQI